MGTRPDQDSDTVPAARLKEGFNLSSGGQPLGSAVHDAAHEQEKAWHTADSIEKMEIQSLLRDMGGEGDISVNDVQGSKTRKLDIKDKIQKHRWWRFYDHILMRQSIEAALERVRGIIEFHQEQMENYSKLINEARRILGKLDGQKEALRDELERFHATGCFDLNQNGRFRTPKAGEALAAWEKNTGKTVDLHSPSAYLNVMEAASYIEAQEAEIGKGVEENEQAYEFHRKRCEEAMSIRNDLEHGGPEQRREALERLDRMESFRKFEATGSSLSRAVCPIDEKEDIMERAGLTDEDLAHDGFAFNFPPLKPAFNGSAAAVAQNTPTKEAEQPKLKATSPALR